MSPADEPDFDAPQTGGYAGTRTRLPEADPYGGAHRPGRSSSRGLVTVVAVVVLLIAAIAFANRGNGSDGGSAGTTAAGATPQAASTAASGTKPVDGKTAGVPTGYAHTSQGVQSAAANYAVALGSTGMFQKDSRHSLLATVYTPAAASQLQTSLDQAYSADFLAKMGLDADGNAPKGDTFVARVVPIGTTVHAYSATTAKVAVWYLSLMGMSGTASTDPVTSSWKTWTFDLDWTDGDWKVTRYTEQAGPAPVPGDDKAAGSDEISKAVEEYGGFTYAR